MTLVFPLSQVDEQLALKQAKWIAELGGCQGHTALVVSDKRVANSAATIASDLTAAGFLTVEHVDAPEIDGWPAGPNTLFKSVAKHIEYTTKEPWLWIEPDAVPLRASWINNIAAEYAGCGKPFMGDYVTLNDPNFLDHMSGIAVYPGVMTRFAGNAVLALDIAWDVYAAEQILPQMHRTKLIQTIWKHPPFVSLEEMKRDIRPECVLFHADKAGSLIDLMRGQPAALTNNNNAPIFDIFIKTYPADYEWLGYCLRSIDKFARGFRRVVIVAPDHELKEIFAGIVISEGAPYHQIEVRPEYGADGYLSQQVFKLYADTFTDADYIMHMDCDCILTEPVTPETFMRDGKPYWLMTPRAELPKDHPWWFVMEKFTGEHNEPGMCVLPEYEYMRRHPQMIPRGMYARLRKCCLLTHGVELSDYIMAQPFRAFSEFNCMGLFAHDTHGKPSDVVFTFLDTSKDELPKLVVDQRWSHNLIPKKEWEEVLQEAKVLPIMQTKEGIWVLRHDSHISRWIEEKGSLQHDYQTLPLALQEIKEGDVVVDAGAFVGDTAKPFLDRVGPTGKVLAFEPNLDACECLVLNLAGYDNAIISNAAITNRCGTVAWTTDPNAGAAYLDGSGISVASVTIDSLGLERCNFIKLDVEGCELRALKGARKTIVKLRPKLLIEINHTALERQGTTAQEIYDWLAKHNYTWQEVLPTDGTPTPQTDILCRPPVVPSDGDEIVPWKSKLESVTRLKMLAEEMKTFCVGPGKTRIVRDELRRAEVITTRYKK